MKNPLISVIMPVYNAEKYLEESIQSILNQTFTDFEFIIINDGSKDKSLEIIKRYQKKDKRIILLNNKVNLKLQRSLNKGLSIAKGKYIARMDADDISLPERFSIQFEFLEKHPSVFLVGGSVIVISEKGNKIGMFKKYTNFKKLKRKLSSSNPFIHPSVLFRNTKEFSYREKFVCSEDYDIYLRMLSSGKIILNLPNVLVKYRISNTSFVSTMPHQQFYFDKAREFYLQRIKYGRDDYENLKPPSYEQKQMNFEKLNLGIKIFAEFQDNNPKVRESIKTYFKKYGYDNRIGLYYLLSFLPYSFVEYLITIF